MKLVFAVAMIAMLAVPAYAQSPNSKDPPKSPQEIQAERAADRIDEGRLRGADVEDHVGVRPRVGEIWVGTKCPAAAKIGA